MLGFEAPVVTNVIMCKHKLDVLQCFDVWAPLSMLHTLIVRAIQSVPPREQKCTMVNYKCS